MVNKFRDIIYHRSILSDEDAFAIELCWKKEIEIFAENVTETIYFLDNECSADEFSWLSEIFEELSERLKSQAFIDCLYRLADKYPDETKEYNILDFIADAEEYLS